MNNPEEALKPCPFCGDKAEIIDEKFQGVCHVITIDCTNEDCGGKMACGDNPDREDQIKRWNRRPPTIEGLDKAQIKKDIAEFVYKDVMKDITKFNLTDAIVDYICQKYGTKIQDDIDLKDLVYEGEGRWSYMHNSYDEDDKYLGKVKGYLVPYQLKEIIAKYGTKPVVYPEKRNDNPLEVSAFEGTKNLGFNEAIDLFRKMNSYE